MSTERDELAELIDRTTNKFNNEVTDPWLWSLTDAIRRAGYRKTSTVTTLDELDVLPYGTIVRAVELRYNNREIGHIFEHVGRGQFLELDPGDRDDGEYTLQSAALINFYKGGITVLYVPTEEK